MLRRKPHVQTNALVEPVAPATSAHQQLRETIEVLIIEAEENKTGEHWHRTPIEDIIHACKLSFAKEVGERIAMKFIED